MAGRGQALYTNWKQSMYFPMGEQPEGWIAYKSIPKKERINVPKVTRLSKIKKELKEVEKPTSWLRRDRVKLEIHDWMRNCWNLSGIDLVVFSLIYNELEITTNELNEILGIDTLESINNLKGAALIEKVSGKNLDTVWSITETAEV